MKVGVLMVCVNERFWQYAKNYIESARKHYFKGHEVEFMLWTDMTEDFGCTIFPTDPAPWPMPTLMRYHLFLQQEEYFKKFDYLFYCDADMLVVDDIDISIFGKGLTCAQHPMYALDRRFIPPYEPNPHSAAYIPRFGVIKTAEGRLWFDPIYAAGGVQGGATGPFIKAMHAMKKTIDKDLNNNYIAIWNDESHWNYYLSQNPDPDLIVLGPDYVYPDSLIREYYEPIWGRSYSPKIITLTKKDTLSKEAGAALQKMLGLPGGTQFAPGPFTCPTCKDVLNPPEGQMINRVLKCPGNGIGHDVEIIAPA